MLKRIDEGTGQPGDSPEIGEAPDADDWLVCVRCGHAITREQWAIAVNGDHHHTVFNPAGHLFRVRCFADAPGAVTAGEPTDHFTWFRGYLWCFALCGGCGEHLGWSYDGTALDRFFGLIATKLRAGANRPDDPGVPS
ncbi:MAG: cereblon family protein [Rhodospirillales bacterium]